MIALSDPPQAKTYPHDALARQSQLNHWLTENGRSCHTAAAQKSNTSNVVTRERVCVSFNNSPIAPEHASSSLDPWRRGKRWKPHCSGLGPCNVRRVVGCMLQETKNMSESTQASAQATLKQNHDHDQNGTKDERKKEGSNEATKQQRTNERKNERTNERTNERRPQPQRLVSQSVSSGGLWAGGLRAPRVSE